MKIHLKGIRSYPQDPTRYFKFKRFVRGNAQKYTLIEGFIDFNTLNFHDRYVYLEFEEPNRFFVSDPSFHHATYENRFAKIFTLCPYTAKWLNREFGNKKRTAIFFPFNEEYIPRDNKKIYDVIYTGHINSREILNDIRVISKFNYRFVSNSDSKYVTNKSASYEEKLQLISKTKVTIVHNLLFPTHNHVQNIMSWRNWRKNEAFRSITEMSKIDHLLHKIGMKNVHIPHLKSRLFEAAFCKSLILCRKDEYRIIENFFVEDKEFVYYEPNNLGGKLMEILKSYPRYLGIIERAYKKAVSNYTTRIFYQKYLKYIR